MSRVDLFTHRSGKLVAIYFVLIKEVPVTVDLLLI